jgi:FkbM family methyltransferase
MELKPGPIAQAFLKAVSWYCRKSPLVFGKGSLQLFSLKAVGPVELLARTSRDGNYVLRFPGDHGWEPLYFEETFETGTTELLKELLRPDDVAFDIGANIGWFTVIFARGVPGGSCHSFEPQPAVFARLRQTCDQNHVGSNVTLNQAAVGDHEGMVELYIFGNLGLGQSSLSPLGHRDYSVASVPLVTLDAYLTSQKLGRVDLIKMDAEGAELSVLKGAEGVLALESPPIWILEMNTKTAQAFEYAPRDLLEFLSKRGKYHFYRIIHGWGKTLAMRSLSDFEHGDNVLCVPEGRLDRVRSCKRVLEGGS